MPLDTAGLVSDLTSLAASPGATSAACATQWADAMGNYASAIVPPSATVSAAKATLETALAAAFALPAAAPSMETAFAAFAATVGGGMAPAFTATPPGGAVGFATQFAAAAPATHAIAAAAVGGIIDAWMKSGSAVPSGGGPAVGWT